MNRNSLNLLTLRVIQLLAALSKTFSLSETGASLLIKILLVALEGSGGFLLLLSGDGGGFSVTDLLIFLRLA